MIQTKNTSDTWWDSALDAEFAFCKLSMTETHWNLFKILQHNWVRQPSIIDTQGQVKKMKNLSTATKIK